METNKSKLIIAIFIAIILCSFYIGHTLGLRLGIQSAYDYKTDYVDKYCSCFDSYLDCIYLTNVDIIRNPEPVTISGCNIILPNLNVSI